METKIRDPEELSADIDRFTLESEIRREVKYTAADIPALERENAADLKRLKRLDADSPEAVRLRDATRARAWKVTQLKKRKDSVITETRTERVPRERGIDALKTHIRANWTIREILLFKDFTHGGTFLGGECDDGARYRWRINFAGYVADTADGQRNLVRLFEALKTEAWTLIGVKTYQNLERGAPPALILCRADADEDSPLDMTPEALLRSIPNADGIGELLAQILAGVNHGNAVAERNYAATERNAAALQAQGADVASTRTGVAFLVNDRKGKIKRHRKIGAENQAKGIDADRERAAADMDAALDRVRRRIADAEKNGKRVFVLDACRNVCREFNAHTPKKNALGKCADSYPLTGADGKPIKPETLAKNYRDRYGGKRGNRKKAVAAK